MAKPARSKAPTTKTRRCARCRKDLPVSDFRPDTNNTVSGLKSWCRVCFAEDNKLRRAKRRAARLVLSVEQLQQNDSTARLLKLTRQGPITVETACNALDLSPNRVRFLITQLRRSGVQVDVEHDHIGVQLETCVEKVQAIKVAPTTSGRARIAVISDTHLGSKYCLRAQLAEFIHYAYAQGVREVLHAGDVIDGDYAHARFEMSHVGLEDQLRDLHETLPQLPGLTYHAIAGNHDFTFTERSGINTGRSISRYFRDHGRDDFTSYGDRSAFMRIHGALVHLWHPRAGGAYARSYHLQKRVEAYAGGEKPQILLAGHWHMFCHVFERGIHAIACPTFQGGGSAFSKSLGGSPAIGGLILSWELTRDSTMRAFSIESRNYFEREGVTAVATR